MARFGERGALGTTAAAIVTCLATPAQAQTFDSEVRIDQLQPAAAGSPFTRAEGPHARFDEGVEFAFRITGDYALEPLRTTLSQGEPNVPGQTSNKSIVAHAALVHLGAALSPLHWLNFDINFPFAVFETGDDDIAIAQQPVRAGTGGLGDVRFGAYGRPVNSKPFDLALGIRFWAPTGSNDAYLRGRDVSFRLEAAAAIAGEIDFFLYGCTAGIAPLFFAGRDGDRAALSCAAHFKVASVMSLGIEPHVAAFSYAKDGDNNANEEFSGLGNANLALQFEPMGGFNFYFDDFTLGVAGGAGMGNAPGTATARGVLNLTYAALGERVVEEGEEDSDLDGIADDYDACPNQAGSRERRGCPSKRDEDGDGIVKGDACPDEPGAKYRDPKRTAAQTATTTTSPIRSIPAQPSPAPTTTAAHDSPPSKKTSSCSSRPSASFQPPAR